MIHTVSDVWLKNVEIIKHITSATSAKGRYQSISDRVKLNSNFFFYLFTKTTSYKFHAGPLLLHLHVLSMFPLRLLFWLPLLLALIYIYYYCYLNNVAGNHMLKILILLHLLILLQPPIQKPLLLQLSLLLLLPLYLRLRILLMHSLLKLLSPLLFFSSNIAATCAGDASSDASILSCSFCHSCPFVNSNWHQDKCVTVVYCTNTFKHIE